MNKKIALTIISILVIMCSSLVYAVTAPVNLVADITSTDINNPQITIGWDHTDLVNLTQYQIDRRTAGVWYNIANISNLAQKIYVDSDVSMSTSYQYRVWANYSSPMTSIVSNIASITVPSNFFGDFSIFETRAHRSGRINVSWELSGYGVDSTANDILNITITRWNGSSAKDIVITNAGELDAEQYIDINGSGNVLVEGQEYEYNITVYYANGESYTATSSVVANYNPRIQAQQVKVNRHTETVTWTLNVTDLSSHLQITQVNASYKSYMFQDIDIACSNINSTSHTCQVSFSEDDFIDDFLRDEIMNLYILISEEIGGNPTNFNVYFTTNIVIPNAPPNVTAIPNIEVDNSGINGPELLCNYNFFDEDEGDVESGTIFKWFVKNEGFNNFVEILGQVTNILKYPKFDNDDEIICSVLTNDGIDYAPAYVNSTYILYSQNQKPLIYFLNTSTSILNPVNVGQDFTITAKVRDDDLSAGDVLNITFCLDSINQDTAYGDQEEFIIGNAVNASNVLWFYSNVQGVPIEEIRITAKTVFNATGESTAFSGPIYDFYVYEVDTYGARPTPGQIPISTDLDNVIVANITNRYTLEPKPLTYNKYLTIKMCINADNSADQSCDASPLGSFTFMGNASYSTISGPTPATIANATVNATSDHAFLYYGFDILSEGCGSNTLCSVVGPAGNNDVTLSCSATALSNFNSAQRYSAIANDGDRVSQTRLGEIYVNHLPIATNVSIGIVNGTNVTDILVSNGSAKTNENLYCNFTIYDQDAETYPSWLAVGVNYSIDWKFKAVGQNTFVSFNNNNDYVLPYGITQPGDVWTCTVTPLDAFSAGVPVTSPEIMITYSDASSPDNRPEVLSVIDNSNSAQEGIYVGEEVVLTVSWQDPDDTEFKFYICGGNENMAVFRPTGCLADEYLRTDTPVTVTGTIKTTTLSFPVPEHAVKDIEYNYSVFVCDNDFECSVATSYSTGNYYAFALRTGINVSVINRFDNSSFNNNIASSTDNLLCNFEYIDQNTGLYYNQDNYSLLQGVTLNVSWWRNISLNTYEKVFENQKELANTQTKLFDRWFCQISFVDAPKQQQTNASSILIKDGSPTGSNPVIESFITGTTPLLEVNTGDTAYLQITWSDADIGDEVYAYVCSSPNIVATGCIDTTIGYTATTTGTSPIFIPYTPTNADPAIYTVYAQVFDASFQSATIRNASIHINHAPTAENVTITRVSAFGADDIFQCNYDYVSNDDTNDEHAGNADFKWYIISGGSDTLVATNNNNVYNATGNTGFIYCTVQVEDSKGNSDTSFIRSSNTESIAGNQYAITLAPIPELVNTISYTAYGILQNTNTPITAYIYRNNNPFVFKTNSSTSFAFENPRIDSRATIALHANVGDTLIALTNDSLGETYATFSTPGRYIGFAHNRSDYTYYNYTIISGTPTRINLNLSEPLEFPLTAGGYAENFAYKNMTGRFEITLPLYPNIPNSLELASADSGYLLYSQTIFPDIISPTITINSSNTNQSNLEHEGYVTIKILDDVHINLHKINITITNGTHWEHVYFSGPNMVLTKNPNGTGIFTSNFQNVSNEITQTITLYLASLSTGSYTFTVTASDIVNNSNTTSASYQFSTAKNTVSGLTLRDGMTGNTLALEGNIANVSFSITESSIFKKANIQVYENTSGVETLYTSYNTSTTTSQFLFNSTPNTCLFVRVQTETQFGHLSPSYRSNCVTISPSQIIISNATTIDGFTGSNTELMSNILNISFSADKKLLDTYTIQLYNRVNNSGTITDTLINTINTTSNSNSANISSFVEYSCYFANITAITIANMSSVTSTNCLQFNSTDSYYTFSSTHSNGTHFFVNEVANFTIFAYRTQNISYELYDITSNIVMDHETTPTYPYGDSINYEFNITDLGITTSNDHQLIVNISGDVLKQRNHTVVFDAISPELGPLMNFGPYYNSDTITIRMSARDNTALRTIYFVSDKNGTNVSEQMNYVGTYLSYDNYTLTLDNSVLSSGYNISYYFIATDFAGNTNISETQKITIMNRPPVLSTNFPKIYWNATATGTFDTTPYITDPDNNVLTYTVTGNSNLTISSPGGILQGFMGSTGTQTLTITASDSFNTTTTSLVIIGATNCPTHASGNIYIGFQKNCSTGTTTSPPSPGGSGGGGGGSGGSGSSGGGGFGGGIAPAPVTQGYYLQHIYNVIPGQKKFVTPPSNSNLIVTSIEFQYAEALDIGTFEITELQNKPSLVGTIGGEAYKYFLITHTGFVNEKFIQGILRLRIPKNNNAGLTQNNVYAARWHEGRWEEYKANFYKEDVTYYYYELYVPGFSYWVVYRKALQVTQNPISEPIDTTNNLPRQPEIEQPTVVRPTIPETKGFMSWLWIILLLLVVGGIAGAFMLSRRRTDEFNVIQHTNQNASHVKPVVPEVDALGEYIKKQLDKGIVREEILAKLLDAGWNRNEIEKAFNKIINYERRHITMDLVDMKIITTIENMLLQKRTEKEIIEVLQTKHIPIKTIQSNLHYYAALQELDVQVTNWIAQGYSLTEVKKHLLDLKWPIATVYEVIKRYKN